MWSGEITIMAHVIHFASFLLAALSQGWLKTNIIIKYATFISWPWVQNIAAWLIVYIAAMYLLPKIGFYLYKAILMDR